MMSKFDELMHKEMTRKEFIKTLGLGVLAIIGLSALMGMLNHDSTSKRIEPAAYGERLYGH